MELKIEKTYRAGATLGVVYTVNGRRCSTLLPAGRAAVAERQGRLEAISVAMEVFNCRSTVIPAPLGLEFAPEFVTSSGRHVRNAQPTEAFWKAWRSDKAALKAAGYSVSKFQGGWQVALWTDETVWSAPAVEIAKPEPRKSYSAPTPEAKRPATRSISMPLRSCEARSYEIGDLVELGGEPYTVVAFHHFEIDEDTPSFMGHKFLGHEGETGLKVELSPAV